MFQISIWSIPPLLAALVGVGAYLRVRKMKRVPGMQALLALLAAVLFWSGAQFIGSVFTVASIKVLAAKLSYFGIVMTPVAWLSFAISYTRRQMRLPRLALNLICVIPLITIALVMTNEWHQMVWSDVTFVFDQGVFGMVTHHGPWFYVHAIYSYGLLLVATTILAWAIGHTTGAWKPVMAVVAAPLLVALANLFYLSSLNPAPWFDMTTLGFAAGAMILDSGVLRYGVLETIPVVRDRVVGQLRDGVIVINFNGMIVDINDSALSTLKASRAELSNKTITDFVPRLTLDDITHFDESSHRAIEITLRDRSYDVSASPLDDTNPDADVVLVLRDVTDRKKTEQDLRDAQEELVRLAHTDYLTGIHNRRFFMQRLTEEIERVRRHGSQLSVLLFDLDYFKQVNDSCGHYAGDQILKAVADVSMEIKRITDIAARIGGEEFALLLPETDQTGAVQMAQRLRQAVARIRHPSTDERKIKVTASIGVATVSSLTHDLENVLNHADEALYKAKHSGRNAVCCADISTPA
jgi:diguanylate cyclase (GGDEF)-like protein/PAS domain S-box-containing protein